VDRSDLSNKTVEGLEVIEKSLMKASGLLHQILDLSRRKPERREPVDIRIILEQSLSLLGHRIAKKQINVERSIEPDLPKLQVDDTQMEQVFTNLGLNAIDAMRPGDTLRIATSRQYQDTPRRQQYVEISIEDTGCGIPSETLNHIFEPFYTTKEAGSGTGLGLFISYGIVEKHGGTIDVESELNVGTRFRVCLPAE
jgi:signal transduction histidine kinase